MSDVEPPDRHATRAQRQPQAVGSGRGADPAETVQCCDRARDPYDPTPLTVLMSAYAATPKEKPVVVEVGLVGSMPPAAQDEATDHRQLHPTPLHERSVKSRGVVKQGLP